METNKKVRIGHVVGTKMDKTVIVAVETLKRHPLYRKTLRKIVKHKVHDQGNSCKVGDKVKIVETRPLSKEKRWRVEEIITRKEVAEVKPQEII
ncbi:MAG: 30S ribosomal protein S17 [Dehalococcoidales bacterium]|nr:30S ribosomal protein S17 [Dehalococcoidales bacterium]